MSPYFPSFISLSSNSRIFAMYASATPMPIEGVGSIVTPHISLTGVYYIPTLSLNLTSVSQLCASDC